jgi:hypothetical protein
MSHARRDILIAGAAAAALAGGLAGAAAQMRPTPEVAQSDTQGQPDPRQDPRSTGAVGQSPQTLSEKLDRTDGVIRPPTDIAPDMSVRAPDPNPGTTRVIPPPGAPGGDPTLEPK